MGKALEEMLKWLFAIAIVSFPLAVWKIVEIIIWITKKLMG